MLLLDFFYQLWKNKEEFNKKEGLVKMEKIRGFEVRNSVIAIRKEDAKQIKIITKY